MRNNRVRTVKSLILLVLWLLLLVIPSKIEAKQSKPTSKKSSQKVLKQKLNYLIALIEKKETKKVETLISQYPEVVNMKDKYGSTAMFRTADCGNKEIARALALAGAKINDYSEDFGTPLIKASLYGNTEVVEELIRLGADINAVERPNTTALMVAAEFERLDIVKVLLSAKARYDVRDTYGYSAFLRAAATGNTEVINEFLKLPIDVNEETKNKDTALIFVARKGNDEIVKKLVERGARLDDVNILGGTPLVEALSNKKYTTAKLLIDLGAKPDLVISNGMAPLHYVIRTDGDPEKEVEFIKLLAVNKAIINRPGSVFGETPLIQAVEKKNFEAVKILLERGADPNIRQRHGYTALRYAKYFKRTKDERIAKLLLEYGAVE